MSTRPEPRPETDRLARDLANAIAGDVRFGLHDRMLYATDASLYQVEPLGVVIPASIDDAVEAVRFCAARGLPILPRGGGTSLAGQCTNRAVVLDFSPRCARLASLDTTARRCRVEPGLCIDDLNAQLAPHGLFFAPDPATSRHATIGGCVGNNAAGARSILYGRTSESVLGLEVCLADGTRVRLEPGGAGRSPRARALTEGVVAIVRAHERLIRERFPKTIRRNAGYALDMILEQLDAAERAGERGAAVLEHVNLAPLLCGSEGTLAVTLAADLLLHPTPAARGLAVASFASVDAAMDALGSILATGPSAVELLDDTVIDLARANAEYRRYVELLPGEGAAGASGPIDAGRAKAVLYVEYSVERATQLDECFEALRAQLAAPIACLAIATHTAPAAMAMAWKLRKAGEPLLHGIPGRRKPVTFVEDNAVPVQRLPEFVRRFRAIVERHGTRAAFYAHASVGVLHVRPLIDVHDERDRAILRSIAVEVADLARELGGVMSGEHGDGRVRSPLLERFYGPELLRAFREVKQLFDPRNLLNPGNIVELEGSPPTIESITEHMRVRPTGFDVRVPATATFFDYGDQHGFDAAVEMCNGSGVCRKKQGGAMCPSYMATLDERHSTRGRANALRLAITGQIGGTAGEPSWSDPETIATLDLCLSCKACKTECPSNVDVARLKAEYTAQHNRQRGGTPWRAALLGRVRLLNRLGSWTPRLANAVSWSAMGRALLNPLLDLDARRSLPPFAGSLARQARGLVASTAVGDGSPSVVLFGDCFTMYNEPAIGLAAIRVLRRLGYRVVLADSGCCGRAMISLGALETAADTIDGTIARLALITASPGVRAVVVLEPSCLSAIKDDWQQLRLRTSRSLLRELAARSMLLEQFVDGQWDGHPNRPDVTRGGVAPTRGLLHGHCHQKALWGAESSAAALRRVLGERLEVLDTTCCGLAGSFGYSPRRYDLSMAIGELGLLPAARAADPEAWIIAPGASCRHQIKDGAARHALHPAEALDRLMATHPPE